MPDLGRLQGSSPVSSQTESFSELFLRIHLGSCPQLRAQSLQGAPL